MKRYIVLFFLILGFYPLSYGQQRVIIDTDIDSDVDDVGALAMLYNLHHEKKINLLGIIVTSDDPFAPTAVSALNTYYGLEHLPIGFLEGQPGLRNHSRYTRQLSEEYPHTLASWEKAATATETYRKLLAGSPDNSVILVTIGHLSSLQKLLQSTSDNYSALNGEELVRAKVKKWYCMGGQFPAGKEANFYRPDPASTVYCLDKWKKEVIFCGWEAGNKVITGGADVKDELPSYHPVYRAYELYNNFAGRASWDQIAVLLLTEESSKYLTIDTAGKCSVETDGSNRWIEGGKSNHGFIKFRDEEAVSEVAALISGWITNREKGEKSSYIPWEGKSVDFSHGPLRVSGNRRFLSHADGTPFFYLGDTAWELFHRLNEEEVDRYLENRRAKGFNVIQAVVLAELDGLNFPNKNGDKPLIGNDPEKPNEAYFKWVDKVIAKAGEKGMYIGLLPTWGDKVDKQWGVGPVIFNTQNAAVYARFLANRYKDRPNIIWIIGGDRSGGGNNTEIWKAFAESIRSVDKNHLMTFHPLGRNTSSTWFHQEEWLDFNSNQTGHAHCCFDVFNDLIVGDYAHQPAKPCINMEPCYEDHPVRGDNCTSITWFDDFHTRQALYWSLFSGTAGHAYGCHPIWQFMSPEYTPTGEVRNNWYDDLDLPGAGNMIHARRLMESHDYYSRIPAQEIILTPQDNIGDMAVGTKGNGYAFIYLPNGNPVDISLQKAVPDISECKLQWFNPRTGKYTFIKNTSTEHNFHALPPSKGIGNDWILVVCR